MNRCPKTVDVVLPANATPAMSRRILENVATTVAPALGWTPAR